MDKLFTNPRFFVVIGLVLALSLPAAVHGQTVVASTSLTAAFAKAAGAKEVRILTPPDVKHPPEYELKPSDLLKLDGARAAVFGGYERMVARLVETSGAKNLTAIKIDTVMSPDNVIAETRRIAKALGTEKEQAEWEKGFRGYLGDLKATLASVAAKRAVAHLHAQAFARWAGLVVVKVLNPGELSAKALAEAVSEKPDVVVDILHMPALRVVADNAGTRYVQVINFPGVDGTVSLEDVFRFNVSQLIKAFQPKE